PNKPLNSVRHQDKFQMFPQLPTTLPPLPPFCFCPSFFSSLCVLLCSSPSRQAWGRSASLAAAPLCPPLQPRQPPPPARHSLARTLHTRHNEQNKRRYDGR